MSSVRNGEGKLMHSPPNRLEVDKCGCGKDKFKYQEVCSECLSKNEKENKK